MTLAELRDKADARLATFWTALVAKEEAYFAKHGRYFYLFITPETLVVDGADTPLVIRETSQQIFSTNDFSFSDTIPFQIRVDEYRSPADTWFEATAFITLPNGTTYRRTRNKYNVDSGWRVLEVTQL